MLEKCKYLNKYQYYIRDGQRFTGAVNISILERWISKINKFKMSRKFY
jgi:hypothetical protein